MQGRGGPSPLCLCHTSAYTIVKLGLVNRYHFHVFDGRDYAWNPTGFCCLILQQLFPKPNPDTGVMRASTDSYGWRTWMVDVRGNDDITLFQYFPRHAEFIVKRADHCALSRLRCDD